MNNKNYPGCIETIGKARGKKTYKTKICIK